MARANGIILWEGLSKIDGRTPVVCILTGLSRGGSRNSKTGGMLQTWIIRTDMAPGDAVQSRQDAGICGGCPHRKQANGKRSCYVNVWQGPTAIYKAYRAGSYGKVALTTVSRLVAGRAIRFGAYGDPAAIPLRVWSALAEYASGYTGYTHQWRAPKFAGLAEYCQASCDSPADVPVARRKGFKGAFVVIPCGAPIPQGAVHCPASAERGKVAQCSDCLKCDGASGAVVAIHAHGSGKGYVQPRPSRVLPTLAVLS